MEQAVGRVAALDVGDVYTGVALSDATRRIPRPLEVVASEKLSDFLSDLVRREGVSEVVVGVPKTLSGEIGFQARRVLDRLDGLREEFPDLRFVEWDERLTTKIATEGVRAARGKRARRAGKKRAGGVAGGRVAAGRVDHLAAARMLQEYLESRENA